MRILALFLVVLLCPHLTAADWNAAVLAAVREMPSGGGYETTSAASARLRASAAYDGVGLRMRPKLAAPSYCSAATYLVLLQVVEDARKSGTLVLDARPLAPAAQHDGEGVWGRWNANGPGTARLFHELGVGRNFTDWDEARPGDFLKIFWRDAVGVNERGHSVVFMGVENRNGVEFVRYWSANKPEGFGEKAVAKSKIARALFSRLERPERFVAATELPEKDRYLGSLLEKESSFAEACRLSGVR